MDQVIQEFINGKRIALVGASQSGKKFGNTAMTELAERGYQVFPVHPTAAEIGGVKCSPNLTALKGQVDGVLIIVAPPQVEAVLREVAAAGIKNVWLQQGAESPGALALAQELGLKMVSKKCVLMYAPPVKSIHKWHRAFAGLFGQL